MQPTPLATNVRHLQSSSDAPEAVIAGLNQAYIQAYLDSDPAAFDALLSPDFAVTLSSGRLVERADFLALSAEPHGVTDHRFDDLVIRVYGPSAVVTATTRFTLPDGRAGETRYTDVYVRQDGRWLAVAAHLTRVAP
jgi:hypothetical protein